MTRFFVLLCVYKCFVAATAAGAADFQPADLRCEYRRIPLGIDVTQPRLSWTLTATPEAGRGLRQSAYQVLVASRPEILAEDKGDLWDSGKVASDQTIHVVYAGKPLSSRMRCHWKVRVWDDDGNPSPWSEPAFWSMGLLKPEDWQAQWIAADTESAAESTPHNGYHSQFAKSPDTLKWVTLDLGKERRIDAVRLWPARPFNYSPDTPGFLYPVRFRFEVAGKKDFSDARTVIDLTDEDVANPGDKAQTYRFAETTARYIRLTVAKLARRDGNTHALALAELQVLAGDDNVAQGAAVDALDSIEQGDWSKANLVDGRLKPDRGGAGLKPATRLRNEFTIEGLIKQATLHATGLGLYEIRLNGQRVGDGLLAPEYTKYDRRVQYRTFDVTDLLQSGPNAVAATLGDGWHGGRTWGAPAVPQRAFEGQRGLRLRMDVELAAGKTATIVTDRGWRANRDGPIRMASIFDGEIYDARKEQPGWDKPGYDASWPGVREVEFPGTQLVWQPNEPIRVTRELTPVKVTEPEKSVYIFDLGQNMVGWCRLKLRGCKAGSEITLRHAERLNPDGTAYFANLRSAKQQDVYICRGDSEEIFEPHFTYHGFRYVEVRGLSPKPTASDLVGRVFNSSAPEAGRFECSNPLINQVMHNAFWSQLGNMTSIPTDCPQRDERAGWMGDIQAFSQTAIFNMNMAAFFTKWLFDVRDSQAEDGRFSAIAPNPGDVNNNKRAGAPAWADAGVFVPWRMYQNYADKRALEQHIDAARRWIDFIHRHNPDLLWLNNRGGDWGDWLNGDTLVIEGFPRKGNAVPKEVLATAFWHESTRMLSKMYAALGRQRDAEKYAALADGIRKAFNDRFVDDHGRISGDTQAGYALALRFGLLDEKRQTQAVEHLLEGIGHYNGHLSTGIQSTHRAMLELSRHGQHDAACRLINLRSVPSWGYTIEMGATTIWERWDGYVEGRGFQDPGMNSFNHWALGSVAEWVWRNIGGLNPDEEHPGWKHFTIAPRPCQSVTWARAEYDSIRGPIRSDWRVENGRIALEVTIPPNTTATVRVPTKDVASVMEGGTPAGKAQSVKFMRSDDNAAYYEVGSGAYVFQAPLPPREASR